MHELSVASAVLAVAREHAGDRRLAAVRVEVGHLRQVVPTALAFAFELTAQGTELDGAELALEEVPAAGVCRSCGAECELPGFPLMCGSCGGLDLELVRGEELLVDALELEDMALNGGSLHDG